MSVTAAASTIGMAGGRILHCACSEPVTHMQIDLQYPKLHDSLKKQKKSENESELHPFSPMSGSLE